jgi:hypothetical protein
MMRYIRAGTLSAAIWLLCWNFSYAEVGNNNPTGVTGEYNGSVTTAGSYAPTPATPNASSTI